MMYSLIIPILTLQICICEEPPPGNLTDFNLCKVSHMGLEYTGRVGRTESQVRCQSWAASQPHKIEEFIKDEHFPEGSLKRAKNYCRNPTGKPLGPWCYTMAYDLEYETCSIPLCKFSQCKLTGPGMEYAGQHDKAHSGRNCLKWNKDRPKVKEFTKYTSRPKFNKMLFPEENVYDAKRFCRNPSGDINGPWCFVENEDTNEIEKEYCDIPFCDDQECLVFTKNFKTYTHYTDFNSTLVNFTFGVKLWNPDSYLTASARLVLSVLALPLKGSEIEDAGIGLEIIIANNYTALRFGNKDKPEYEPTPGILKSTAFTTFSVSWHRGFLSFGLEGSIKPIFLAEYNTNKNLLGYKMDKFNYYSVQGTNVLWSFPFCKDDFECDAHTTTGSEFQQFWPLREKGTGLDLYVYIRAHHSACILFVASPMLSFPNVKITLSDKNEFTRIIIRESPEDTGRKLKELQIKNVLNYWEWREFSISFFTNMLSIYVEKSLGLQSLADVKDDVFRSMRWFSVSSEDTVAHWSFFCTPPSPANPPPAFLPECALDALEENYHGKQDVTNTGLPCLPWTAKKLIGKTIKFPPNNTALAAVNYCRDPTGEGKGSYCYTISLHHEKKITKNFCRIRKCKSEQCKMAGTGHDYSGNLFKTRSNRTCVNWVPKRYEPIIIEQDTPSTTVLYDKVKRQIGSLNNKILTRKTTEQKNIFSKASLWNDTLFPDGSAAKADNFCRNPSRNLSGSWCYTNDPNVPEDACNVRDCDKPEECTVIVSTTVRARRVFILPQWKETGFKGGLRFAIKEWNPDDLDGVSFIITPRNNYSGIILQIAADHNEKIKLFKEEVLIVEKTMPHLIGAGKWTDFWLQIRRGEIMLGLEGVPTALFEWTSPNLQEEFEPAYFFYRSIFGKPLGLSFKCNECHTENATLYNFKHVYPIGMWLEEKPIFLNLTLIVRGSGTAIIKLMRIIDHPDFYMIYMDIDSDRIILFRVQNETKRTILLMQAVPNIMTNNSWTRYELYFNETNLTLNKNGTTVLSYASYRPIIMYWFSMAPQVGWVTWTANCEPVDLDGPPRDGGWSRWSPWTCSAKCGGGEGFRTRTCSNPRPNIMGKLCQGPPTSTGRCNEFPCGDVSPETLETIREHLRTQKLSYVIPEGSSQLLQNDGEILKIIAKESPKAYYEWTLNGIFVKAEPDRIVLQKDDILIKSALPRDSGLYISMLFRVNKEKVVLRVISLAVKSENYDHDTRATRKLTLPCNAVILGYIYSDLSLKIYLNDHVVLDHGTTTLAAVNTYAFNSLRQNETGDWKCVVEQKDLGLSWTTNYMRINVKKAPNIFTNLMEDDLTKPIFGWMRSETLVLISLIFIVAFVIGMVVLFLVLYRKYCTLKTLRFKRNRNR